MFKIIDPYFFRGRSHISWRAPQFHKIAHARCILRRHIKINRRISPISLYFQKCTGQNQGPRWSMMMTLNGWPNMDPHQSSLDINSNSYHLVIWHSYGCKKAIIQELYTVFMMIYLLTMEILGSPLSGPLGEWAAGWGHGTSRPLLGFWQKMVYWCLWCRP
jgi:hypothetical protein